MAERQIAFTGTDMKQHQNVKAEDSHNGVEMVIKSQTTRGGSSPLNYLSLTFSLIMWVDL